MKLAVLADSHDHLTHLERAVALLAERKPDYLIHAGDFVAPFALPPLFKVGCPVKAVFGNNDGERAGLAASFEKLGGEVHERPWLYQLERYRILVLHEAVALEALAGSRDFDLIVYGHDHQLKVEIPAEGPIVLNPGETCGWLTGRATCLMVDLAARSVEVLELG